MADADRPIDLDRDEVFGRKSPRESAKAVAGVLAIPTIRENARGRIATWIVAALLSIVVLSYVAFLFLAFKTDAAPTFNDLKDLTEALIAPVAGIVGAVTGFYFGEKKSDTEDDDESGN
jgi:hypothetical protein